MIGYFSLQARILRYNMASHKKLAGFDVTLGASGELRFKRQPSQYNKYIGEALRGETGTKEERRQKFAEASKKYKEFKEQEYPMQYLESLDQRIHKLDSIISKWKEDEKFASREQMLDIAPITLKKIKEIIC